MGELNLHVHPQSSFSLLWSHQIVLCNDGWYNFFNPGALASTLFICSFDVSKTFVPHIRPDFLVDMQMHICFPFRPTCLHFLFHAHKSCIEWRGQLPVWSPFSWHSKTTPSYLLPFLCMYFVCETLSATTNFVYPFNRNGLDRFATRTPNSTCKFQLKFERRSCLGTESSCAYKNKYDFDTLKVEKMGRPSNSTNKETIPVIKATLHLSKFCPEDNLFIRFRKVKHFWLAGWQQLTEQHVKFYNLEGFNYAENNFFTVMYSSSGKKFIHWAVSLIRRRTHYLLL